MSPVTTRSAKSARSVHNQGNFQTNRLMLPVGESQDTESNSAIYLFIEPVLINPIKLIGDTSNLDQFALGSYNCCPVQIPQVAKFDGNSLTMLEKDHTEMDSQKEKNDCNMYSTSKVDARITDEFVEHSSQVKTKLISQLSSQIFTVQDGHLVSIVRKNIEVNLPIRFNRQHNLSVYLLPGMTWEQLTNIYELFQKKRILVVWVKEGKRSYILIGGLRLSDGGPMCGGKQTEEEIIKKVQESIWMEKERIKEEQQRWQEERRKQEEKMKKQQRRIEEQLRREKERLLREEINTAARLRTIIIKQEDEYRHRKEEEVRLSELHRKEQEAREKELNVRLEELLRKVEQQEEAIRKKEEAIEQEKEKKREEERKREEAKQQEERRIQEEMRKQEEEHRRMEIVKSQQIQKGIAQQLQESIKKLEELENMQALEKEDEELNKKIEEEIKNKEILERFARLLPVREDKTAEEMEAEIEESIEAAINELILPFD